MTQRRTQRRIQKPKRPVRTREQLLEVWPRTQQPTNIDTVKK